MQAGDQVKHGENLIVAVSEARAIPSHNHRSDVHHPRILGLQFEEQSFFATIYVDFVHQRVSVAAKIPND